MKNIRIARAARGFGMAMLLTCAVGARCLPFGPASEPDDIVFNAGIEVPDAGVVRHSARPDVARAAGDRSDHQADAHAAAYRRCRLQRV